MRKKSIQNAMAELLTLAVIIFIAFASPAFAEKPDPASIPALKMAVTQGLKPVWIGQSHGLNGWLITKEDEATLLYTTADGKAFVPGVLYDEKGKSITGEQMTALEKSGGLKKAALSKPPAPILKALDATKREIAEREAAAAATDPVTAPAEDQAFAEKLYSDLEKTSWFKIGNDGLPYAYMFFDPMCPYCKLFYVDIARQALTKGKIQLRMVPVAILMPESAQHASAMLAARDPVRIWNDIIFEKKEGKEAAGNDASMAKAKANTEVFQKWNLAGVPVTVYRGKDGKVVLINGRKEPVDPIIASIGG